MPAGVPGSCTVCGHRSESRLTCDLFWRSISTVLYGSFFSSSASQVRWAYGQTVAFQKTSGLGDMLAEVTTLRAEDY